MILLLLSLHLRKVALTAVEAWLQNAKKLLPILVLDQYRKVHSVSNMLRMYCLLLGFHFV